MKFTSPSFPPQSIFLLFEFFLHPLLFVPCILLECKCGIRYTLPACSSHACTGTAVHTGVLLALYPMPRSLPGTHIPLWKIYVASYGSHMSGLLGGSGWSHRCPLMGAAAQGG